VPVIVYERGGALRAGFPRWGSETNSKDLLIFIGADISQIFSHEVLSCKRKRLSEFS